MIIRPVKGQRVEIRHAAHKRAVFRWHGCRGTVEIVACGRGPLNTCVQLDNGELVVVPRGNIRPEGVDR